MTKRISDQEIVSCGWIPTIVRIQKDWIDEIPTSAIYEDEDILIPGWTITRNDKEWCVMYRNSRRLTIVNKWNRDNDDPGYDTILDCPISTAQELKNEMGYLSIKGK